MVGQNNAEWPGHTSLRQDRLQLFRHLRSYLDSSQASTHDKDRKPSRRFGSVKQ
jgi:hypothetical protein